MPAADTKARTEAAQRCIDPRSKDSGADHFDARFTCIDVGVSWQVAARPAVAKNLQLRDLTIEPASTICVAGSTNLIVQIAETNGSRNPRSSEASTSTGCGRSIFNGPLNAMHCEDEIMSIQSNLKELDVDLHGYHPDDIIYGKLDTIVEQGWQMGCQRVTFIHGHGRGRGISPGFVNTNTGYFGLQIRSALRHVSDLRKWIKHTTLDCSDPGVTSVKLKKNPAPSRTELEADLLKPIEQRPYPPRYG
jgi:hypothetical protein